MISIVTKTGDHGDTGLVGGMRVMKDDPRLHAYGTVDELNALLGVVLAEKDLPSSLHSQLNRTQSVLFHLGATLATPNVTSKRSITKAHVQELEEWINAMESVLPPLRQFILPGGSRIAATLHHARTVCRRAERWVITLKETEDVSADVLMYCNRLSDYLFLAARMANVSAGIEEEKLQYDN